MYINYTLRAFDRALAFQVVNIMPAATEYLKSSKFVSKNGWELKLGTEVELLKSIKTIYLYCEDGNNRLITKSFDTNAERDTVMEHIAEAFSELNELLYIPTPQPLPTKRPKEYYNVTYTTPQRITVPSNIIITYTKFPDVYVL